MKDKLNIGCARKIMQEYVNLDIEKFPGVDVVHDLNKYPYPFKANQFREINADNVLEHLDSIVKPLEELWRITKNNGIINIWVPIFPSVWAFADPTHKQIFTYFTFNYFNKGHWYCKAKFKVIERKIIFHKFLKFMNPIINCSENMKKIYSIFLSFLMPAMFLKVKLLVKKENGRTRKP